jgi:hypothetical protein
MSSSELIRWGGLAAMLAGATFIVLMLIPEGPPGSFLYTLNSLVFVVAVLLMLAGLAGFHALQKGTYGRVGRAGFYTVAVAGVAQIVAQVGLMSGSTALEFLDFLGLLGVMVGLVLYGAATLQARVLPRWCGVHRRLTGMVGRIGSLEKRIWRIAWGDDIRVTVAGARLCALVGKGHSNRGTFTTCALGNPVAF